MDNLDINPRIITAVKKAKICDYGSILSMSGPDLERSTVLSTKDISVLHLAVAHQVYNQPVVTGLDLHTKVAPKQLRINRLTTGCVVLDGFLKGGILSRGVTEIAGESASGKTQLCLQLCVTVQLPVQLGGLDGGAVYVCTEDAFPNKRLMQITTLLHKRCAGTHTADIHFTDNIFIEHAADIEGLWYCLMKKIPVLLERGKVKLVVIDSIAALFRCEFDPKETFQRAKRLASFGAQLHHINSRYNVPIVCVNQVSASVTDEVLPPARQSVPALGLTWANTVTTRLVVARTRRIVSVPHTPGTVHCVWYCTLQSATGRYTQQTRHRHTRQTTRHGHCVCHCTHNGDHVCPTPAQLCVSLHH